ncbi:hypothetical protein NHF46_01910 [Arthrobacter alpinus]|nr:hypothetical protein [Arthrobacter alpinus]
MGDDEAMADFVAPAWPGSAPALAAGAEVVSVDGVDVVAGVGVAPAPSSAEAAGAGSAVVLGASSKVRQKLWVTG